MGFKRFVKALVIFLAVFVFANLAVWELHTVKFFDGYNPSVMGGLARLGYMPEYAVAKHTPPEHHPGLINYNDYYGQPVDMVVIGDSFSMGAGGGEQAFFQEHIILNSGKKDFTVLSLISPGDLGVEAGWKLLNTGLLERIGPRYLLIENVERNCIEGYGLKLADVSTTDILEDFDALLSRGGRLAKNEREGRVADGDGEKPFFRFMTFANLKHPFYKALYMITDRPPGARVYKAELDRPLFSTDYPNTLLFFHEDIEKMSLVSEVSVAMLNRNMNELADAFAKKGVMLYFMPAPDKYGLYAPYIKDNDLPISPFFSLMRKQDRRYGFIDTAAILSEALEEGVMDLYHADDTHWSWKAPDRIFRSFSFRQPDKGDIIP